MGKQHCEPGRGKEDGEESEKVGRGNREMLSVDELQRELRTYGLTLGLKDKPHLR